MVLEACYGWYWAADTLAAAGAEVHLLGVKGFSHRRVKNDPSSTPAIWPTCSYRWDERSDGRLSRSVLWEPGGEIPPGHPAIPS